MNCPVCKVPAYVVEYQGVELDICGECQGVWFDRGELNLVLGYGQPVDKSLAETSEEKRRCPICTKKMDKVNIGPASRVLIDSCPEGCGLWFDAGELGELTQKMHDEGLHIAPEVRDYLCSMFTNLDEK